ncbi:MAG TPA: cytochrome c oxidase subunit 3 [Bacteroidia bacterium]|jgi:cytochrome c oxidase subunit 3|nr:cytochrome c oxidase subunit 3 [Bacteroidia bacterium]
MNSEALIYSEKEEKKITREKVSKPMLWLGMVSMLMVFAGLSSAYVVSHESAKWLRFELPQLFYVSTAVIILSSVTMNTAVMAAKKNNFRAVKQFTLFTLLLGVTFIVCQFKAWGFLVSQGIYFAGKTSNPSGSYLYALTFLHMLHLVAGIISLLVVWVNAGRKKYNSENLLGIQLSAIFWHFLDVLWIYLFLFLLFIR